MNLITFKDAKDYLDGTLNLKELRSKNGKKSRERIFKEIISVISFSKELNIIEKREYLENLKSKIQRTNSDKLMPLIKRTEELTLILFPNIHSHLQKLDSEYNTESNIENYLLKSAFPTMFTHFVLNSVSRKFDYRTNGAPVDLSIKFIRDSLRSYVKDKTLFNNLEHALRDAFQINLVSDDYNLFKTNDFDNHKGLLTFLINRMIAGIKPELQGKPYSFMAAPNLNHNIFLKISYSGSEKKFIVQVINTGTGSKSIGNGRLRDIVYKGVRECDLKLLVDFFLLQNKNFSFHKWKLEKIFKSKSFSSELGFEHSFQQGDNCVIKSLMSCINQSFPDRIDYKAFKFHLTQNLIQRMEKAIESNLINEHSSPRISEKLNNAYRILKKRKLKKEILEIENLVYQEKNEVKKLNKVIKVVELTIQNHLNRSEEFKSEIDDLKSKITELKNIIAAKTFKIDSHNNRITSKEDKLEKIYIEFE